MKASKYEITDITRINSNASIVEVLLKFSKNNLRLVLTVTDTKNTPIEVQVRRFMMQMPTEDANEYRVIDKLITEGKLEVKFG